MTSGCPWHTPNNPSKYPFRLTYTGLHAFDNILCTLGTLFEQNFTPRLSPFFNYFTASGFVINLFPAVEGYRRGNHSLLTHTLILRVLNKTTSVAVAMPIWFLILILTKCAAPTLTTAPRGLSRADAEKLIAGFAIGNIIPTILMSVTKSPRAIALWQFYPLWIHLTERAITALRPSPPDHESGFGTLRSLWGGTFLIAALSHIYNVWPKVLGGKPGALKEFMIPSFHALPPDTTSFADGVYDFMKWDFVLGFAAATLVTVWFYRTRRELVNIIAWNAVAVPLVGPSAAVIGVIYWREAQLAEKDSYSGKNRATTGYGTMQY